MRPKQEVFIEEYLATWNATEAAKRAGYSERTAASIGAENLIKPEIAAAIQARIADKTMKADEVMTALAEIARGDMGNFLDANTYGRPVITLDKAEGKTHLIKKYSTGPQGTGSIELYDRQRALETIGKALGVLVDRREDKVEHSFSGTAADVMGKLLPEFTSGRESDPDSTPDE